MTGQIIFDVVDASGAPTGQIDGGVAVRARIYGGGEIFEPVPMDGDGYAAYDAARTKALLNVYALWAQRRDAK